MSSMTRELPAGKKRSRDPLAKWAFVFIAPFLISYIAFTLYPIIASFQISLTNRTGIQIAEPAFVGLDNYRRVLTQDPLFWRSVFNTARIMVMAIPASAIFGLILAVLLTSLVKWRPFVQTVNFLPYIITPVAVGFMFSYLFDVNIGPINELFRFLRLIPENINWLGRRQTAPIAVATMMFWTNFGYYMILYLAGLSTIPNDLYEAAKVDGANPIQTFFKITLPMLRPITIFVIIQGCIGGFQLFDEAVNVFFGAGNTALGGPERSVLTVIWYFYDVSFLNHARFGYGAAIAFSLFLIIATISLVNVTILNRKER